MDDRLEVAVAVTTMGTVSATFACCRQLPKVQVRGTCGPYRPQIS